MGEVLEKEMRDPAHEQSDHNSGGETAPAPKEGPTRSPESRPGSSRQRLSSAWAQLLETMCLPDWLPACVSLRLADRRLGLCEGFAAFYCGQGQPGEMPSDVQSNGTMTPEWGQGQRSNGWKLGALWACALRNTPKTPIMTCYADGEECAQPTGFAKASPWIRAPLHQARRSAT